MKTNTILASMLLTACGAVVAPSDDPGTGQSGSGSGAGSDGSGAEVHAPGQLYGSVRDERGDAIDFATGEPVHTHAGATIDLGAGNCPAVYKYAYLMDQQGPRFGRETATNPLVWHVTTDLASLDTSATAYRVRTADGRVLLDWTSLEPDGQGVYTIELHRAGAHGIAALGTETGKLSVEVRFRDIDGKDTIDSACWEHHPLAAPFEITPIGGADLFGWTLPAGSPISKLINTASPAVGLGWGADIASGEVTQYAGEPITFQVHVGALTGNVTKTVSDTYVAAQVNTTAVQCPNLFQGACTRVTPPAAVRSTSTSTLDGFLLSRVVDEATGQIVCQNDQSASSTSADITDCTIPARAADQAPRSYRLVVSLASVNALKPSTSLYPTNERLVGSQHYTGDAPVADAVISCTNANSVYATGQFFCYATTHYSHVVGLQKARIDFDPFSIDLTTAPSATATFTAPAFVLPSSITLDTMTWDAGDDGL